MDGLNLILSLLREANDLVSNIDMSDEDALHQITYCTGVAQSMLPFGCSVLYDEKHGSFGIFPMNPDHYADADKTHFVQPEAEAAWQQRVLHIVEHQRRA